MTTTMMTARPDNVIVERVSRYAGPGRRWRGVTSEGLVIYGETADDVRDALAAPPGGWIAHYAAVRARIAAAATRPAPAAVAEPAPAPTAVAEPEPAPEPPAPPVLLLPEPDAVSVISLEQILEKVKAKRMPGLTPKARRLRERHATRAVKMALHPHIRRSPELRAAIAAILEAHCVSWPEVVGNSRSPVYLRPRLEVYRLLTAAGWSRSEIARAVNRDHTTVIYYLEKWGQHDQDQTKP